MLTCYTLVHGAAESRVLRTSAGWQTALSSVPPLYHQCMHFFRDTLVAMTFLAQYPSPLDVREQRWRDTTTEGQGLENPSLLK